MKVWSWLVDPVTILNVTVQCIVHEGLVMVGWPCYNPQCYSAVDCTWRSGHGWLTLLQSSMLQCSGLYTQVWSWLVDPVTILSVTVQRAAQEGLFMVGWPCYNPWSMLQCSGLYTKVCEVWRTMVGWPRYNLRSTLKCSGLHTKVCEAWRTMDGWPVACSHGHSFYGALRTFGPPVCTHTNSYGGWEPCCQAQAGPTGEVGSSSLFYMLTSLTLNKRAECIIVKELNALRETSHFLPFLFHSWATVFQQCHHKRICLAGTIKTAFQ